LYVVLPHPRTRQPPKNQWRPDHRLVDSILTNSGIATLCNVAQMANDYVYVHRCAWGSDAPEITQRGRVESVTRKGRDYHVVFSSPEPMRARPPVQPMRGQQYYFDEP
jgi:hypothetical protein